MFDHISIVVTDLDRARRFYDAVLAPLGIVPGECDERTAAYSCEGSDDLTLIHSEQRPIWPHGTHICFWAPSRKAVRAVHQAGVQSGGQDDGAAGLRPQYGATYHGAFLINPDGYRVEVVAHAESG